MTARTRLMVQAATVAVMFLAGLWLAADALASPAIAREDDANVLCPLAVPPGTSPPTVDGRSPRLSRICFVPLGEPKSVNLAALAAHYQERFGVTVGVLPPVTPGPDEYEPTRRQYVGEELIVFMRKAYPELDADRSTLLIGITESDIYLRNMPSWNWAFAERVAGRFAVISTARMDPARYRLEPSPALLNTRARKITTKTIGLLYFGLPLNSNPESVLYDSILGLDDLDAVGEDF